MRMAPGGFNVYYQHDRITPHNVRVATYGERNSSGGVLPEVGDVIHGFPGDGTPIAVRVTAVEPLGQHGEAYQVTVSTVQNKPGSARAAAGGVRVSQPCLCGCGCGYPTAQANDYVRGHTPKRGA